ncbi:MAG: amidohydrolase [Acidobacteria bacterium]|nr:amidohydrolase [Acidobacteriota bacterium]
MKALFHAACLLLGGLVSAAEPAPDLILRGGRVYTVNPAQPWAEAVALRGDLIVGVGSNADVDHLAGDRTTVIDLGGRLVLPGFNDAHIHFLEGSLALDQVGLDSARSLAEMQERVRAYAAARPEQPWIVGRGWIYEYVDGGRLPTRADLDAVVSDRPVYLEAYDGHTAWVSSKALELAKVNAASVPDGYGEIVKDPKTGLPTGVLKEGAAMEMVHSAIPKPTHAQQIAALRLGLAEARRNGVCSIQNASGSLEELDLYQTLLDANELTVRVYAAMTVDKQTSPQDLDLIAAASSRLRGPWIKAGAVKIFMDGVIESHTAGMLEPYSDDPTTSGSPEYTEGEIDRLVSDLDRRGFQIFTHAIGDRSVRMVLDAYARAASTNPTNQRRHRIEHIETISAEDIPRFAGLGVVASMQPYHASPDITGVWARNAGEARQQRAFAWQSIRTAGAHMAHGSDWPVVTLNPLVGLHAAVTREDLEGKPDGGWIPVQRLSLEQAIPGYTRDAAYASFDDEVKGSIQAGKLADLVVLADDIFAMSPRKIGATAVMMTIAGGRIVYETPGLARRPTAPGTEGTRNQ